LHRPAAAAASMRLSRRLRTHRARALRSRSALQAPQALLLATEATEARRQQLSEPRWSQTAAKAATTRRRPQLGVQVAQTLITTTAGPQARPARILHSGAEAVLQARVESARLAVQRARHRELQELVPAARQTADLRAVGRQETRARAARAARPQAVRLAAWGALRARQRRADREMRAADPAAAAAAVIRAMLAATEVLVSNGLRLDRAGAPAAEAALRDREASAARAATMAAVGAPADLTRRPRVPVVLARRVSLSSLTHLERRIHEKTFILASTPRSFDCGMPRSAARFVMASEHLSNGSGCIDRLRKLCRSAWLFLPDLPARSCRGNS
jgi:hypothetical protein